MFAKTDSLINGSIAYPPPKVKAPILKKVKNNESANVIGECWGFNMTKVLAVPVKAMVVYDKFFENVLSLCQKGNYHGPITFVNSNEIARCF